MLLIVLVCSLSLAASGQQEEDDWIDPFDMLNYDASTKTMRKPAEDGDQMKSLQEISVTFTTFITELRKSIGERISEFHRTFKDLPVTLQVTVFVILVLCILVFIYIKCRPRRDPPPAQLQELQHHIQEIDDRDHLAGGDAPQPALKQQANDGELYGNQVRQRRVNRPEEEPAKVAVKTLRAAEPHYNEDKTDAPLPEQEQNLSAESDAENKQEKREELAGASASSVAANTAQSETKPAESDSSPSETEPPKNNENPSKDELSRDGAASQSQEAERLPSQTDVQDLQASAEDGTSSSSLELFETLRDPVQETSPITAE